MDVVLQSRTPKYGIGRIHPKTAAGHGRIALLLLSTVKNGGITGVLLHHFDWSYDDWPRLAGGTLAGHLLECSTQLTGGYFADPGKKDVIGLANIGYP